MSTAAVLLPLTAATESQVRNGTANASLSATAQLNFKIIIPTVLYLQVGPDGVILGDAARKPSAQQTRCTPDGKPAVAGSRLICTASMP
jgi:hypothetical protein